MAYAVPPSQAARLLADMQALRDRYETDEGLFWGWLAAQVPAEHYANYRVEPVDFVRQLHDLPWQAHLDILIDQAREQWLDDATRKLIAQSQTANDLYEQLVNQSQKHSQLAHSHHSDM